VLRVEVERDHGQAGVALFGADGGMVAEWVQPDHEGHRIELSRSHDGEVALVVVDAVITAVRLNDGHVAGSGRAGRGIEASFPLDGRWTLDIAGELTVDGGHTGHQSGVLGFSWTDAESRPDPAEIEAEWARHREAANRPIRRRLALRRDTGVVVVHDSSVSPAAGGEALLWPPITGPTGVLLRHAIVTDEGRRSDEAPQPPWFVHRDGTITLLPFVLGVSPLAALDDGRWLLPGVDTVWRDDPDEPLSVLDATGVIEPLLVGGRAAPVSRVLCEAVPELLASVEPIDPDGDVPWHTVSARLEPGTHELLMTIEIDVQDDVTTLLAVRLPLAGTLPARVIARFESTPRAQIAVAP
jgi:hypothetical protein